jgi:E1A/CREB-binding protein
LNIKHKLKQQQLQQRLQQAQLLRRRMAVMNTRSTVPSGALPGNSSAGGPGGVLAGGTAGQAGVMSGQPGAGNMVSLQTPHQPAGSKPGTQTPPANVLQVVKQVSQEKWLLNYILNLLRSFRVVFYFPDLFLFYVFYYS